MPNQPQPMTPTRGFLSSAADANTPLERAKLAAAEDCRNCLRFMVFSPGQVAL
jgi:hypothetical protein